jgi:hypothetical protein
MGYMGRNATRKKMAAIDQMEAEASDSFNSIAKRRLRGAGGATLQCERVIGKDGLSRYDYKIDGQLIPRPEAKKLLDAH